MTDLGFLCINKPEGISSHDVVARLRRQLKIKRIGHSGTLDPFASGVLVCGIGSATRLMQYLATDKIYAAEVDFSTMTDTDDHTGEVIKTNTDKPELAEIQEKLKGMLGKFMQLPPLYSAIKKKGKKLYELMRSGKDLKLSDIDPREVEVLSIKITSYSYPKLSLEIEAKAGLYVRSIARDLGGHLSKLVRLQSNAISLDQALELEDVNQENLTDNLLEPSTLIQLPKFLCNKTYRLHLEQGRALKLTEKVALKHDFFQCIDESNDELIGVAKYDEHNLLVKPKIIL